MKRNSWVMQKVKLSYEVQGAVIDTKPSVYHFLVMNETTNKEEILSKYSSSDREKLTRLLQRVPIKIRSLDEIICSVIFSEIVRVQNAKKLLGKNMSEYARYTRISRDTQQQSQKIMPHEQKSHHVYAISTAGLKKRGKTMNMSPMIRITPTKVILPYTLKSGYNRILLDIGNETKPNHMIMAYIDTVKGEWTLYDPNGDLKYFHSDLDLFTVVEQIAELKNHVVNPYCPHHSLNTESRLFEDDHGYCTSIVNLLIEIDIHSSSEQTIKKIYALSEYGWRLMIHGYINKILC